MRRGPIRVFGSVVALLCLQLPLSSGQSVVPPQPADSDAPTTVTFTFGGSGIDHVNAIAVDAVGNIYVAGYTNSTDLPATEKAFQQQPTGYDAFVAKLDAHGEPVWTTYLGGNDRRASSKSGPGDVAVALDVDHHGNVYVAGATASTDFPIVNAFQSMPQAPSRLPSIMTDGFIAKLSADGSRLLYSSYLGASDGSSRVLGLRVGLDGEVWLLVSTSAASFEITRDLSDDGGIIVMKLNAAGSPVWATRIGNRNQSAAGLVVDDLGQPIIAGSMTGRSCEDTGGSRWCAPAFITKLNRSGSRALFTTTIGGARSVWLNGTAFTNATDLAIAADGRIIVAGVTSAADLPVKNAWQPEPAGEEDVFVAVLGVSGDVETLSYFGGNGSDRSGGAPRVAVDGSGILHMSTDTYSTNMPVHRPLADRHVDGPMFVSRDEAENWEWSSTGAAGSIRDLAFHPDGDRLYAATSLGVLRSTDAGASWAAANEGLLVADGTINQRPGPVESIAVDPRQPNVVYAGVRGLFRSEDGAETWTLVRPAGSGVGGFFARVVRVSPRDSSIWVAAGNGVEVSVDGGVAWEPRNQGLPVANSVGRIQSPETLVFDPRRQGVVYAGLSQGLFVTTDDGASWRNLTTNIVDYPGGLPSQQFVSAIALDPYDPAVIYAGTFNRGLLKTTDGGETWSRVLQFTAVRSVTVDPESPNVIYVASRGSSQVPGRILRSRDGGQTWEAAEGGLTMRSAPAVILVHPVDWHRLYAPAETLSPVPFVTRFQSQTVPPSEAPDNGALEGSSTLASYLAGGSVRDIAATSHGDSVLALLSGSVPQEIVILRIGR